MIYEPLSPNEMFLTIQLLMQDLQSENYEDLKILINLDDKDIFNNYSNDVYMWSKILQ